MKKILIIQPHSDDVLFSASKYLFENRGKVLTEVLTIENGNPKRVAEDEKLCEFFNVKYHNLGIEIEDDSYYHYYKDDKKQNFNFEKAVDCVEELYGEDFLNNLKSKLVSFLKKKRKEGFTVVCCLGIGHPMHYYIRLIAEPYTKLFYRDFPHSYKRKAQDSYQETLLNFDLKSEYKKHSKTKFEIAYDIYRTQRSLLWFEQGYINKKLPEQFYTKR